MVMLGKIAAFMGRMKNGAMGKMRAIMLIRKQKTELDAISCIEVISVSILSWFRLWSCCCLAVSPLTMSPKEFPNEFAIPPVIPDMITICALLVASAIPETRPRTSMSPSVSPKAPPCIIFSKDSRLIFTILSTRLRCSGRLLNRLG